MNIGKICIVAPSGNKVACGDALLDALWSRELNKFISWISLHRSSLYINLKSLPDGQAGEIRNSMIYVKESRTKKFAYVIIALFFLNFIMGGLGTVFENESMMQTICWHISTTSMIAGCVFMGAYVAERGWSFASGGFYLLGVANGVFFASLSIGEYSPMTLARGILVLIPSFFAIGMSNYFKPWLKWLSVSISIPFIILYIRILSGKSHIHDAYEIFSFFYLNLMAILWAINIWKEMKKEDPGIG
jgi:hypothetical protein